MTSIILSGANGKMGRVIASCVRERDDCRIVAGVDINTEKYDDFDIYSSFSDISCSADVVIDFSHPSVLSGMLDFCLSNKMPVVISTTGYSDDQTEKIMSASESIPIFFSFNMSLGINLLIELAKKATSVLGGQFDIEIIEKHHNKKIDAPSGTAVMIANAVNDTMNNSLIPVFDRHSVRKKRGSNEIGIHSVRGGTIVGEHEIIFAGRDEVLSISHSAGSKEIFAVGSVNAALFLSGKAPGIYKMSDMI